MLFFCAKDTPLHTHTRTHTRTHTHTHTDLRICTRPHECNTRAVSTDGSSSSSSSSGGRGQQLLCGGHGREAIAVHALQARGYEGVVLTGSEDNTLGVAAIIDGSAQVRDARTLPPLLHIWALYRITLTHTHTHTHTHTDRHTH